jgi:hypothetical protein
MLIGDGLMAISYLVILFAPVVWPVMHTTTSFGAKTPMRALDVAQCDKQITNTDF